MNNILHIVHWKNSGIYTLVEGLYQQARKKGFKHKLFVFNQGDSTQKFSKTLMAIGTVYRLNNDSISKVHCHSFFPLIIAFFIFPRLPLILTIHNDYPFLYKKNMKSLLKKKLIKFMIKYRGLQITCVSKSLYNTVETSLGVEPEVIVNGTEFNITKKQIHNSDGLIFGAAGRFDPQKNFIALIQAFLELKTEKSITLQIAGDGKLLTEARELIKEKKRNNISIELIGRINDMSSFYQNIDCFICSSHYEGFGLVILEAALSGIPVISTNVGIVEDEPDFGNIAIQADVKSISEGVLKFINLTPRAKCDIAQKQQTLINQKYTIKKCFNNYLKVWG